MSEQEQVPVGAKIPLTLFCAVERLAKADGKRSIASVIRLALEEFVAAREAQNVSEQ